VGLGFMGFFAKAVIEALKAFPKVNAFIDGTDLIYHHYYNIGVAVGTERGLFVPVLRHAEHMSLAEIELSIKGFAQKAKEGKISPDDLNGGTFTISNGGVYGSLMSTPICALPPTAKMRAAGRNHHKTANLQEAHRHFFGRDFDGAHSAGADVDACARVWFAIKDHHATAAQASEPAAN
jgi:pyruvate/2-oxoglutarate dehydrogenase complex dihydrolipoamide acyltransferase (E2) component